MVKFRALEISDSIKFEWIGLASQTERDNLFRRGDDHFYTLLHIRIATLINNYRWSGTGWLVGEKQGRRSKCGRCGGCRTNIFVHRTRMGIHALIPTNFNSGNAT